MAQLRGLCHSKDLQSGRRWGAGATRLTFILRGYCECWPVGCAEGQQDCALPYQGAVQLAQFAQNIQTQLRAPLVDGDGPDLTLPSEEKTKEPHSVYKSPRVQSKKTSKQAHRRVSPDRLGRCAQTSWCRRVPRWGRAAEAWPRQRVWHRSHDLPWPAHVARRSHRGPQWAGAGAPAERGSGPADTSPPVTPWAHATRSKTRKGTFFFPLLKLQLLKHVNTISTAGIEIYPKNGLGVKQYLYLPHTPTLTRIDLHTPATAWQAAEVGKSIGRLGSPRMETRGRRPFCRTNSWQWSSVVLLLRMDSTNFIWGGVEVRSSAQVRMNVTSSLQ